MAFSRVMGLGHACSSIGSRQPVRLGVGAVQVKAGWICTAYGRSRRSDNMHSTCNRHALFWGLVVRVVVIVCTVLTIRLIACSHFNLPLIVTPRWGIYCRHGTVYLPYGQAASLSSYLVANYVATVRCNLVYGHPPDGAGSSFTHH